MNIEQEHKGKTEIRRFKTLSGFRRKYQATCSCGWSGGINMASAARDELKRHLQAAKKRLIETREILRAT
jgi:hypothetical protein